MGVENIQVIHGKLVALKCDSHDYTTYVFQNYDSTTIFNKYIMCVRFPNWECPRLQVGDTGYVKYKQVIAGKDKWYSAGTDTYIPYKYTDIHFIDFIFDKKPTSEITL